MASSSVAVSRLRNSVEKAPRWSVWLYVPNVIGYIRILLSCAAFFHWRQPPRFAVYYSLSFVLDAADGYFARILKQATEFGALLDMLTDRCATAALLIVIAALRLELAPIAIFLVFLDGYSHWLQFAAGLCSSAESHKTAGRGRALELYYWRPVLTFVCTLNEFCFIALYMLSSGFAGPPVLPTVLQAQVPVALAVFWLCLPVCVLKQVISVRQIFSAHFTIRDAMLATRKELRHT